MKMAQKRILFPLMSCLVAWSTIGLATSRAQTTPQDLIATMVETINSKNEANTLKFLEEWMVSKANLQQRAKKFVGLSEQGGPFKLIKQSSVTSNEVDAIVTDREGTRLVFRLHIQTKPSLKIVGLQIAPAFTVEGPDSALDKWKDLNELASQIATPIHSPGMAIAVIRNGAFTEGVAGVRTSQSIDPVQTNDVWSIGSIGKSVCTSVIGRLVEMHKLTWDETLKHALPGVSMKPGYAKVTIEQLMLHRGGIPQDLGFRRPDIDRIVGKARTGTAIRARYVADILKRNPIGTPGEKFAYSNAGYALLSYIAESKMGKSYESLVKETVFRPLGLAHSFTGIDVLPASRPSGHVEDENGIHPLNTEGPIEFLFAGAGGGMYMSMGDLAKFGQAHLSGLNGKDGFLKSATIKWLHRGFLEQPGGKRTYACGWGIERFPGLDWSHSHNGSNGTQRAQLSIFPRSGLVISAAVNLGGEKQPSPGLQAVLAIAKRFAAKG